MKGVSLLPHTREPTTLFSIVAFKVQLLQEFAGETVSLSRDNDVTKYNVIMKNNESAPRFLAVGAVAINMR